MLLLQTDSKTYWTENFQVSPDDLEFLYNIFLEEETPIRTPDLIQRLIAQRIADETRSIRKLLNKGTFFQPSGSYEIGQELVFPAFAFQSGKILSKRPGHNPEHGEFSVLEVEFENGECHDIASELTTPHQLNDSIPTLDNQEPLDAAQIYTKYKRGLTPVVVEALRKDEDTVFITGRWFLKSLLLEVNEGFLNLAEAVIDMNDGKPTETDSIAEQIDFGQDVNKILRCVSFDYALSRDSRFDEVGPAGKVWWFLKRMEPEEILTPPPLLRYHEHAYDLNVLTDSMFDLSLEIGDELADHEILDEDDELAKSATVTLTYPHWSSGTLPLTQRVEHLFPFAYRAPRICITLVDAQGDREMDGWVVREFGYVYGLGDFYQRHKLPVGALVSVRADEEDASRLIIDFSAYRPRNEWVWVANRENERLHFVEGQQLIGAEYDDLMILGIDDLDGIANLAENYRQRDLPLSKIMADLMRELAQFSPQNHVHCKTLYSAVNILHRCPPAPIFATLVTEPDFLNAGGPYWRLA